MQVNYPDSKLPIVESFSKLIQSGLIRTADIMGTLIDFPLEHSETQTGLISVDSLIETIDQNHSLNNPYNCFIQSINGSIQGFFLFTASPESISTFVELFQKSFMDGNCSIYVDEKSVMQEWTNIFSGNMLAHIDLINTNGSWLSIPEDTYDMYGSVLNFIASQMGLNTDYVLTCFSRLSPMKGKIANLDFWFITNPNSEIFNIPASKLNKLICLTGEV